MTKLNNVTCTDYLYEHRALVHDKLATVSREINTRARRHDQSSLSGTELRIYKEHFDELQKYPIFDPRRDIVLSKMRVAIAYHHEANDHHPEHFTNGIDDMNLLQLMEFVADVMSQSEQNGIDVYEILPLLKDQYDISNQLYQVILNTVAEIRRLGR